MGLSIMSVRIWDNHAVLTEAANANIAGHSVRNPRPFDAGASRLRKNWWGRRDFSALRGSPTPTGFAEIIRDDFPILHAHMHIIVRNWQSLMVSAQSLSPATFPTNPIGFPAWYLSSMCLGHVALFIKHADDCPVRARSNTSLTRPRSGLRRVLHTRLGRIAADRRSGQSRPAPCGDGSRKRLGRRWRTFPSGRLRSQSLSDEPPSNSRLFCWVRMASISLTFQSYETNKRNNSVTFSG